MFFFKNFVIKRNLIWRISSAYPVDDEKDFLNRSYSRLGCGQQHGSVYWKDHDALEKLKNTESKSSSLVDLLQSSFSRIECPIWMDSSTTEECQALEQAVGGAQNLFQITGSKAYERFTGSQIMKVVRKTSEIYQQTERIQLISNFLASLLLGQYAPVDLSDGSGMNLLDIRQHQWSTDCLNACGEDLAKKLSEKLVYPRTALGTIANYFVEKYGFDRQCQIVSCTGDNPSSYYALASDPRTVVISLGTSDTVMAAIPAEAMPKEAFDGHLLVNPLTANPDSNLLMLLLCFKNGSLVRERKLITTKHFLCNLIVGVRQEIASKDWKEMSESIGKTKPSKDGCIGFFYDDHEILPQNIQGRFYFDGKDQRLDDLSAEQKARAVLEAQCLAKRLYLKKANVDLVNNVDRIVITGKITMNRKHCQSFVCFLLGGASVNTDLAQIIADIFAKPVYAALVPNSGALGGALRAFDVITHQPNSKSSSVPYSVIAQPRNEYTGVYDDMLVRYTKLEENIVQSMK